ncbi:pyridoxamine 5'-phosphate oxidase family protein [Gemmatimonadota bacterium]
MPVEPYEVFKQWFAEAVRVGISLPTAMALATADDKGRPSVRYVLLKDADESGFSFCTNHLSRKGREIVQNPQASIAFYWHEMGRQAFTRSGETWTQQLLQP